jgi:hypothetical protein
MARTYIHEAVVGLLASHGVPCSVEETPRHNKVLYSAGGRKRMQVCARTQSDGRALLNALADVRRVLRAAGVIAK